MILLGIKKMSLLRTIAARVFNRSAKVLTGGQKSLFHHLSWHHETPEETDERALSTLQAKIVPQATTVNVGSKEESREFMAVFPDIVRDLTDAGRHTDIPEVTKWYAKVLQHNVPNGKKNRGLAVVAAYKMLEDAANLTPENVRLANILGWCVEMFQSFLVITDDLIDSNENRRGDICWYRNEDIGLKATNDSFLIENGIFVLLKKHFSQLPCYLPMLELFHEAALKSAMGQTLDFFAKRGGVPNLDAFTMSRYDAIVKYRHSYHSFYLPVALAMFLSSRFDPEMHRQARTILLEMGHFFQVQEDFLNCFGDPVMTGKKGTDIKEGRCTWLSVVALQRASPVQKQVFEAHYGRPEPESTSIIKNLYEELSLPITYSIYEEESFKLIKTHIHQISKGLPHEIFLDFMEKLFRREC
ncbi:farnesyl pyrophosphate synthase isoform X3 [Onthophagus taurus]|uniref:farnesyl pyrophosphate synthase isoform X3 n=2 Tax=Onthophagus taurus TaxID=166361 RepID=UPI0039BDBD00